MNFKLAAAYLLDSQFCCDAPKFISGVLCCLSAMTGAAPTIEPRGPCPPTRDQHARGGGAALELPHVNVLSKCDLLPSRRALDEFLDADADSLQSQLNEGTRPEFLRLNSAICELISEWSMVQFLPLDPTDTDSIDQILAQVDNAIQYHDDVEPMTAEDEGMDDPDDD